MQRNEGSHSRSDGRPYRAIGVRTEDCCRGRHLGRCRRAPAGRSPAGGRSGTGSCRPSRPAITRFPLQGAQSRWSCEGLPHGILSDARVEDRLSRDTARCAWALPAGRGSSRPGPGRVAARRRRAGRRGRRRPRAGCGSPLVPRRAGRRERGLGGLR